MFSQSVKILWLLLIVMAPIALRASEKLASNIGRASRIVNGHKITIDQAPYIVELRSRYEVLPMHWCGGTLIAPQYVVTAAHCFDYMFKEEFVIVGGASKTSERGEQRFIEKVFIHPDYNRSTGDKDVAVLKLNRELSGKFSKPIALCDKPLNATSELQVSGWGRIGAGMQEDTSEHLRSVTVPVMAQEKCVLKSKWKVNEAMVCAAGQGGDKDASGTGDSGGPGIYEDKLCAIVSWGMGSASRDYPGVYLRIDAVRDFIEASMQK